MGSKLSSFRMERGFTLIELLIVIVILGVLAGGVILAIDPLDRVNFANDSKIQTIVGTVARASEAYAVTKNGFYPKTLDNLTASGDLKALPSGPYAQTSVMVSRDGNCIAGGGANPCTGVVIYGQLKSKKNGAVGTSSTWYVYYSVTGKTCTSTAGAAQPALNTGQTEFDLNTIPAGCQ